MKSPKLQKILDNYKFKEPNRLKKHLDTINKITSYLEYYMGGDTKEFRELIREEICPLEECLVELSLDQKLHDIRLAKKLKKKWELQNKSQE